MMQTLKLIDILYNVNIGLTPAFQSIFMISDYIEEY